MKTSSFFLRRIFFPALLLSFLAFLGGFGIAYQQDAARAGALGNLAWLHFSYAEEMKDDMAVIDWSKNLERLDTVRAFRVTTNSRTIVDGGNADFLPAAVPEGIAFLFPSNWSFRSVSNKEQAFPTEFILILHLWPGPGLWGLFCFLATMAVGCAVGFISMFAPSQPASAEGTPRGQESQPPSLVPSPSVPSKFSPDKTAPYLFIDKNYIIRQVSPSGAGLLQKKPEQLLNGHLLDLEPHSDLIQAFEKGMEAKIQVAFPHQPSVQVQLKPDPNGCLLILESGSPPKPL